MKSFALILALFIGSIANAEIQQVSVKWSPSLCQNTCVQSLEKQFRKVDGVDNVSINQPGGQMTLKWKPNSGFTATSIYNAMAMIGLYITEFRVKAAGTISHTDKNIFFTSSGDGTKFLILGSIQPSQTQYVVKQNVESHQLPPQLDQQLLQYEQSNQQIIIDGPLFEAYRSPPEPLRLVAENVRVDNRQ